MIDNRHATTGTSAKFEVNLPETITLLPPAVCVCIDVVWGNSGYIMGEFLTSRDHNHFLLVYQSVCATITYASRKE